MALIASLPIAAASPAATPASARSISLTSAIDCARLEARPLAASALSESVIAYQAVRACEGGLDFLKAQADNADSDRERATTTSLRLAYLDRMREEARATVREQRGR
ncbi:MAG TPA: hypothetical protein VE891_13640 [Allosphingosinicella sp.]|nr:hypothetical protein [Allosphingosinicella sp.]